MCSRLHGLVSVERGKEEDVESYRQKTFETAKIRSERGKHVFLGDIMGAAERYLHSEMIILRCEKQLNQLNHDE